MKKFLAITLILTFAVLAIFGVYAMNHETCFAHGGCLVEALQNNPTAFKEEITAFIFFFAAAMIFLVFALHRHFKLVKLFLYFSRWFFSEFIYLETRLARWLAMRENSPSVI